MCDAVLAFVLDGVHGSVGLSEHEVHGARRGRPCDDADAEADGPLPALDHRRDLPAHARDDCTRCRVVRLRHEDDELVAAEARD